MDGAFHLAVLSGSGHGGRVVGAFELDYLAGPVLYDFVALDDAGVFQAHFSVRLEPEVFVGRFFHEVSPVDQEFTRERNLTGGAFRVGRVERAVEPFHPSFLPVGDGHLDGIVAYSHISVGTLVEVLADAPFQKLEVHHLLMLGNPYPVAEHLEGFGGISPAAHSAKGRHTGVVPSGYVAFLYKFQKFTLAHQCVGEVQAGEFILV